MTIIKSELPVFTVSDIITRAYRISGDLGPGETMTIEQAEEGLKEFNNLLSKLPIEKITVFQWKDGAEPLTAVNSLNEELTLPPGYRRMLSYNLAVEFAEAIPPSALAIARSSKAAVKRNQYIFDNGE